MTIELNYQIDCNDDNDINDINNNDMCITDFHNKDIDKDYTVLFII